MFSVNLNYIYFTTITKQCIQLILIMLVGTDVCVRMVFMREETGVPKGNPPVWLDDHMPVYSLIWVCMCYIFTDLSVYLLYIHWFECVCVIYSLIWVCMCYIFTDLSVYLLYFQGILASSNIGSEMNIQLCKLQRLLLNMYEKRMKTAVNPNDHNQVPLDWF